MPSIWARMSGSSSTIRISCAMLSAPHAAIGCLGFRRRRRCAAAAAAFLPPRQEQHRARASALSGVFEAQLPAVVLHDLLHDGKAEAGALGLVRDVGLGEAVAFVALRQADAVVLHR